MIFTYFNKFPTINYENVNIRDLSRRVTLSKTLQRTPMVFHPYEIKDSMRADQLAYMYYKDVDSDWLIHLTNGIVDPYYGWYLDDNEFFSFLIDKYGSLEEPQQRIFFWQTNWSDDEFDMSVNGYASLPVERQKYWVPKYGQNGAVLSYRRRKEDWRMNTNRIIEVDVTDSSTFTKGDLVVAWNGGQIVGRAEVDAIISDTRLYLFHVLDDWEDGSEIRLRDLQDEESGLTISGTRVICENITDDESSFWEPIYYYDYERMINEDKKIIMLLDSNYLTEAASALTQKLKED